MAHTYSVEKDTKFWLFFTDKKGPLVCNLFYPAPNFIIPSPQRKNQKLLSFSLVDG